tara:strand:- start:601 stop:846 length:246 start_codon:yes stop_codon:yes gene_type:complete
MNKKRYEVVVYQDGSEFWYYKLAIHRENGPAVTEANGTEYWYLKGKCMPKEEWEAVLDSRVMTLKEVEDKLGYKIRIVEGK